MLLAVAEIKQYGVLDGLSQKLIEKSPKLDDLNWRLIKNKLPK